MRSQKLITYYDIYNNFYYKIKKFKTYWHIFKIYYNIYYNCHYKNIFLLYYVKKDILTYIYAFFYYAKKFIPT